MREISTNVRDASEKAYCTGNVWVRNTGYDEPFFDGLIKYKVMRDIGVWIFLFSEEKI